MRSLNLVALLFAACNRRDAAVDDCELAAAKSNAVLAPRQAAPTDRASELAQCREQVAKHPGAANTVHCIASLPSTSPEAAEIDTCLARFARGQDQANDWLHVIVDRAESYYRVHHAFPTGQAGPLPAWPDVSRPGCCGGKDFQCAVTTAWDTSSVWHELRFRVTEPTLYAYSYESDGKTFKAAATGDADCDGELATYTLTGSIGSDGKLALQASLPPHGTD